MEQICFEGIVLDDTNIIHDSTKALFRYPLGAVTCHTKITLALKNNRIGIEYATLCVLHDGVKVDRVAMEPDGEGFLRASYAVSDHCILWYWFEIKLQGGVICYYGANPPYASGLGRIYHNPPPAFQITVYDKEFSTPDWAKTAILYQIFPDRFYKGNPNGVVEGLKYHHSMGREEFVLHCNWEDLPDYEPKDGRNYYIPSDIFGGDLEGIRQRLPYLKELGVTLLYLNPIFESASNHRYNTGDYMKVDPILGDEDSFRRLSKEALESGIRIILDGVFSHTGDDSLYFNKYGRYESVGAYQNKDSPYHSWYKFEDSPEKYASWWGFETLPEVNEFDPEWIAFMISGREGSVVNHWLREGASGYRLDVADELPDECIEIIRATMKETSPETFLLGEVWEDATTKQSYGKQRSYALGRGLDSVMNYPFLNRTIEYLTNRIDAWQYCRFLTHQRHVYPAPMYFSLMNLLSSHDVSRVRTMLASDVEPGKMLRSEQAQFTLSEEEYELGGRRQCLAVAIQFSMPGMPSIYYGDETGMTGLFDPFNRKTFRKEDAKIIEWYRKFAEIRREHPVMSTGEVRFFATDGDVLGILRHTVDGCDYFGKKIGEDYVLTVVNPGNEPRRIVLEMDEISHRDALNAVSPLTGQKAHLEKYLVEIDIAPLSAEVFVSE